jgi:NDP-sugar pyrophosphorylase family protein
VKALVLCAGFGTRLGSLTEATPKPLLDVGGEPLVAHALRNLSAAGIEDVFVNLHHRSECFMPALGDGSRFGVSITYVLEPALLGTAGTPRLLRDMVDDALLVHYGDIVTDCDLGDLIRRHRATRAGATIVVHKRASSNSCALLDKKQRVVDFVERPTETVNAGTFEPWVFSGIAIVSRAVLDEIPDHGPCDLPRDVFPRLAKSGRLYAQRLDGYRVAVDSPSRLRDARTAFEQGFFSFARPGALRRSA